MYICWGRRQAQVSMQSEKSHHPRRLPLNLRVDVSAALVALLITAMLWSGAKALGSPGGCWLRGVGGRGQ